MKNSPHRQKHLRHKAIREASHIQLHPSMPKKTIKLMATDNLRPLNTRRCKEILYIYKKHLERARLFKTPHDSRQTTPGEVEKGPFTVKQKSPTKITSHWQSSDLERSKQIARKMLKQSHMPHKKAA